MELIYLIVAFVAGFVTCLFRSKIGAYLARRAAASKIADAQKLVDAAKAAEAALVAAKATLAAQLPPIPPNPKP